LFLGTDISIKSEIERMYTMSQKVMTVQQDPAQLAHIMGQTGLAANTSAARRSVARHIEGKAKNTERRKRADLELFEKFLQSVNIPAAGMFDNPQAW